MEFFFHFFIFEPFSDTVRSLKFFLTLLIFILLVFLVILFLRWLLLLLICLFSFSHFSLGRFDGFVSIGI